MDYEVVLKGALIALFVNSTNPELSIKNLRWWIALISLNTLLAL